MCIACSKSIAWSQGKSTTLSLCDRDDVLYTMSCCLERTSGFEPSVDRQELREQNISSVTLDELQIDYPYVVRSDLLASIP